MKKVLLSTLLLLGFAFSAFAEDTYYFQYTDNGSRKGQTVSMRKAMLEDSPIDDDARKLKLQEVMGLIEAELTSDDSLIEAGCDNWKELYKLYNQLLVEEKNVAIISESPCFLYFNKYATYNYGASVISYFPNGVVPGAPYEIYGTEQLEKSASDVYNFDVSPSDIDSTITPLKGNLRVDTPEPLCGLFLLTLAVLGLRRR